MESVMIMGEISEHYHIVVHACVHLEEINHQIVAEGKGIVVPLMAVKACRGCRGIVPLILTPSRNQNLDRAICSVVSIHI
jgi:hypothetical protein